MRPFLAAALICTSCSVPGADVPPTTLAEPTHTAPQCVQAFPVLVERINAAFTGGEVVDNAQQITSPTGAIYIGGNILRGNELLSSADVWLSQSGQLYSLTSDVRKRTSLPDGRGIASAGDVYGAAVQECVT